MVKDGIDVSQYQGEINWELVKNHIDFAILRCGFGQDLPGQDDPTFKRNADECTRLGIPFGVYLYSYATDERAALSEARHVMRLIQDYQMEYPIYLDLEDPSIGRLTNDQIEKNARVWADELAKHNYFPGFYASYYWWTTKLTGPTFKRYTRWVARYAEELGVEGFDMWQYTNHGFVEGISVPVDRNHSYRDFPTEIKTGGYNNFNVETNPEPAPEPEVPQQNYQVGDHVTFNHVFISFLTIFTIYILSRNHEYFLHSINCIPLHNHYENCYPFRISFFFYSSDKSSVKSRITICNSESDF